jgi:hypothetical protein
MPVRNRALLSRFMPLFFRLIYPIYHLYKSQSGTIDRPWHCGREEQG